MLQMLIEIEKGVELGRYLKVSYVVFISFSKLGFLVVFGNKVTKILCKINSPYQVSILHGSKVITLEKKKSKRPDQGSNSRSAGLKTFVLTIGPRILIEK